MTAPESRWAAQDVGTLVTAITENAHRLGLKWLLRPATVTSGTDPGNISAKVDGDEIATLGIVSMIGVLFQKTRVFLLIIPSVGTYVIGRVGPAPSSGGQIEEASTRVANVGTFTAETQTDSVTVILPITGVYRVIFDLQAQSSVADGAIRARIREDSVTGTQLALRQVGPDVAAQSFALRLEGRFTCTTAGDEKTFVGTVARQGGTGLITATASADAPTFLYVEYVSS